MSKEMGKMVRSRDVAQAEGEGARRATGVPADGALAGSALWRRGSGGAPAGSATWCCGYCVANRWRRCPVRRAWRSTGSKRGGSRPWLASSSGLKARHGEPVAEVLDAAKRHIGELSMGIELLRERARAAEQRLPLAMRRLRR